MLSPTLLLFSTVSKFYPLFLHGLVIINVLFSHSQFQFKTPDSFAKSLVLIYLSLPCNIELSLPLARLVLFRQESGERLTRDRLCPHVTLLIYAIRHQSKAVFTMCKKYQFEEMNAILKGQNSVSICGKIISPSPAVWYYFERHQTLEK